MVPKTHRSRAKYQPRRRFQTSEGFNARSFPKIRRRFAKQGHRSQSAHRVRRNSRRFKQGHPTQSAHRLGKPVPGPSSSHLEHASKWTLRPTHLPRSHRRAWLHQQVSQRPSLCRKAQRRTAASFSAHRSVTRSRSSNRLWHRRANHR